MENKTSLVTGSTDGLGKQTTLQLAYMGFHVLVYERSRVNAKPAVKDIRAASGSSNLEALAAGTSSYMGVSPQIECLTGRYFINKHPVETSNLSRDVELRRTFREVSPRLTRLA
jgi:NAD(P)-dependent dehydrogenase (short-subunit alcohol dehydrogenase family)